jgi:NAD(P)-dependent dehydrogenase (short-subunit alcohol dehydrogenase family)
MASGRVVLIKGCSSPQGIGFASARVLAQAGHSVDATVRNHANDAALAASPPSLAPAAADQRPARTRAYVRPHRRECAT